MKKIISVLIAVVLVVGCSIPALAAVSPEKDGIIEVVEAVDSKGEKARMRIIEVDDLDEEKEIEKDNKDLLPKDDDEEVIRIFKVEIDGDVDFPVTVTAKFDGVNANSNVYILAKKADGTVVRIEVKVGKNGEITFELDEEYVLFSLIADKKTSTQMGTSDKTGDDTGYLVMAIAMVSVLGIAVSVKKIKEN